MSAWFAAALLATVIWGMWGFTSKLTSTYDQRSTLLLCEGVAHVSVSAIIFLFGTRGRPEAVSMSAGGLALLTGVLGSAPILPFLYALKHGNASTVVSVTALYPAITVVLAYFILKEPLDLRTMAGVACALLAAFLLAR